MAAIWGIVIWAVFIAVTLTMSCTKIDARTQREIPMTKS